MDSQWPVGRRRRWWSTASLCPFPVGEEYGVGHSERLADPGAHQFAEVAVISRGDPRVAEHARPEVGVSDAADAGGAAQCGAGRRGPPPRGDRWPAERSRRRAWSGRPVDPDDTATGKAAVT